MSSSLVLNFTLRKVRPAIKSREQILDEKLIFSRLYNLRSHKSTLRDFWMLLRCCGRIFSRLLFFLSLLSPNLTKDSTCQPKTITQYLVNCTARCFWCKIKQTKVASVREWTMSLKVRINRPSKCNFWGSREDTFWPGAQT